MTVFLKQSHEGYIFKDMRCSGGGIQEFATVGCNHCGSCFVVNWDRTRPRNYCPKCDRYLCDGCEAARRDPDYIHLTIDEKTDLLKKGQPIYG